MKNFMQFVVKIKSFAGMLFCGFLILFLISRAIIYQIFEVSALEIVWLFIVTIAYSVIVFLSQSEFVQQKINKSFVVVIQFVVVIGLAYLFNYLFNLFALSGIEYLYFGLAIVLMYIATIFGFWIVAKMGVDVLNVSLKRFNVEK